MNTVLRREQVTAMLFFLVLPLLATLLLWERLPAEIPIHWNLRGEVDNYVSKSGFLLYQIGTGTLLGALFYFLPTLDPKRANYEKFSKAYGMLALTTIGFMSFIWLLVLAVALGYPVSMDKVVPAAVFLLFSVIGNYLTTVKPNYLVGIRTPWTLESEVVWRKTHRFGGKVWFYGGLLLAMGILLLPGRFSVFLVLAGALALVIIPLVYSYRIYRKEDNDLL